MLLQCLNTYSTSWFDHNLCLSADMTRFLGITSHFLRSLQHVLPSSLNWHFKTGASHDQKVHASLPDSRFTHYNTSQHLFSLLITVTTHIFIHHALMKSTPQERTHSESQDHTDAFLPETVWTVMTSRLLELQLTRSHFDPVPPFSFPFSIRQKFRHQGDSDLFAFLHRVCCLVSHLILDSKITFDWEQFSDNSSVLNTDGRSRKTFERDHKLNKDGIALIPRHCEGSRGHQFDISDPPHPLTFVLQWLTTAGSSFGDVQRYVCVHVSVIRMINRMREVTIWHSGTCGNLRNALPSISSSFSSSGFALGPVVCVWRKRNKEESLTQ